MDLYSPTVDATLRGIKPFTMIRMICMFSVMFSTVMMTESTGCVYPDYLQEQHWVDKTTDPVHDVQFIKDILNTHQNQIHLYSNIDWHCFRVSSVGSNDLVVSRAVLFGEEFFRCELYHKTDTYHVYYKSLQEPYHVSKKVYLDRCNICSKKGIVSTLQIHPLEIENAISPKPNSVPNFGCGESGCEECPATPVRALKDEARSLEYLLRQWLADKNQEK